jgi:hypothetical protein
MPHAAPHAGTIKGFTPKIVHQFKAIGTKKVLIDRVTT